MEEKYISEKEFYNRFDNYEEFPNPLIKKVGIKKYHLIPEDCQIQLSLLQDEEYEWYYQMNKDFFEKTFKTRIVKASIISETHNNIYFPIELIAGVDSSKKYSENTSLSLITGYLKSKNSGSSTCLFREDKVKNMIKILRGKNFNCKFVWCL